MIKMYVVSQQPEELQDRMKKVQTAKFRATEATERKSSTVVACTDEQIKIKLKSWHDSKLHYDTISSWSVAQPNFKPSALILQYLSSKFYSI